MDYLASKISLDNNAALINNTISNFNAQECQRYESSIATSLEVISVAYEIQSFLQEFNDIKALLDTAHKENNAAQFSAQLAVINSLLSRVNFTALLTRVNRRKRWLKVVSPLRTHVIAQLLFIKNTRDSGKQCLKHMQMTPKQRLAAKRTSVRMKTAWGMQF